MADTMKLEIVTPDATVYSEDVDMVTLQAIDGQIGVFPHHVPLLTQAVPGEMIVRKDGQERFLAVGDGLVLVTGERPSPSSPTRYGWRSPPRASTRRRLRRRSSVAAARLRDKISDEEVASVNAALARSLAQLKVKHRRRV